MADFTIPTLETERLILREFRHDSNFEGTVALTGKVLRLLL
ncbi:MAG: hypothetical protein ABJQ23_08130 [Shimia thalassica]